MGAFVESQRRRQALRTFAWLAGVAAAWALAHMAARSLGNDLWWLIHPSQDVAVGEPVTDPVIIIQIAVLLSVTRFVFGFATTWLAVALGAPKRIWVVALVVSLVIAFLNTLYLSLPASTTATLAAGFCLPDAAMVTGAWFGTRRRTARSPRVPTGTVSADIS